MTFGALLTPIGAVALLAWSFLILAAVQLTIRLIMRFSVAETLRGAFVVAAFTYPPAALYDLILGPAPTFDARLQALLLPAALMALVGYATTRWVLRFKRARGQVVAALMIGFLSVGLFIAPYLFSLAPL